jgi:tripartite ATP-independent transporter DctP family solute receptor
LTRIREATGGRLDIKLFPANQLGSDTDLLTQVRNGSVEFFNLSTSILATFVPVAGMLNTGFAFKDYDTVWKAMDGDLGTYVRAQIAKTPIMTVSRPWDNGFRHITSSTRDIKAPDDLKGFKIRVPPAPMLTSLFKALDAGPAPINFNELYSALQTKVVEGQENPLAIIATARLYEVQKSCSLTGHVWDGYWILGNKRSFERLPKDVREVVTREFDRSAADQRADVAKLSVSLREDLSAKGIQFFEVDREPFRQALGKTSFYKDWKAKYGDEAWSHLEKSSGKLG